MSPPASASPASASSAAPTVVGVKLHPGGRTVACTGGGLALRYGDRVVIDDGRETQIATVAVPSAPRPAGAALPRILRRAEPRDLAHLAAEEQKTADALAFARARAAARGLPMKLFRAELQPAGRAQFTFSAETRVDFRELVRDLAAQLHARIELRQVGARDEAKLVGGIGSCGRELCCSTFLPKFAPVSIKMAKHQSLALTPSKVSGQCGRLKCCLVYEDAAYIEAAAALPKPGRRVVTPEGTGRVGDLDVLRGRVRVYYDDKPPKVFPATELTPSDN
jgi:cell fate regulator YaaT (PSP1 superfamily)